VPTLRLVGSMQGLSGRTAIVTGGASGIGLAIGARLVQHGARVVLADINGEAAERRADELNGSGGEAVLGRRVDVSDEAAFRSLVDEVIERDGRLDMLFNNAGVALGGPTHEHTAAHWDRVLDVNLRGVVNGVLAAYPRMVEQRQGHIVNTASGAGLAAPPFVTAYAASKHAVVGLSLGLRPEAALHGVKVNVLCPGAVDTPILDRATGPDLPTTASKPVTAREYLAVVRQKPASADDVARRALKGLARNRALIVVPASTKPLWYLQRLSPRLAQQVARTIARKVNRELIKPLT
jgi:NAD(P)-dependent dehydrogenase (short-subunit alcohol dehydrogenase family)